MTHRHIAKVVTDAAAPRMHAEVTKRPRGWHPMRQQRRAASAALRVSSRRKRSACRSISIDRIATGLAGNWRRSG